MPGEGVLFFNGALAKEGDFMILNLISLLFGPNDVFMNILEIIFYILVIIGQWKMFEKAGESGWKALIPIYNLYILYKII